MSKFTHPFNKVARDFRDMLRTLPHEVSVLAANDFRENFRRQGYINRGGVLIPWRRRAMAGKGSNKTRAILVKTGQLLRGNRPAAKTMMARVVNSVQYAQVHNEGFKGSVSVPSHQRNLITKTKVGRGLYSIKTRRELQRTERKVTGTTTVTSHTRRVNMPRRPFMVDSPVLFKQIERHIDQHIESIWQRA